MAGLLAIKGHSGKLTPVTSFLGQSFVETGSVGSDQIV